MQVDKDEFYPKYLDQVTTLREYSENVTANQGQFRWLPEMQGCTPVACVGAIIRIPSMHRARITLLTCQLTISLEC